MEANSLEPSKSDIFISYARADRERVQPFADMLIEHGWMVWWDLRIRTGEQFHLIIEEALAKSACVVVVWTEHSTQSRWVLAEADEGANRRILVPILLDQVPITIAFRGIHSADFINWSGDVEEEKVQTLIRDISAVAGKPERVKGVLVPYKDVMADQPQLEPEKPDSVSKTPDREPTQSPVFQWLKNTKAWLAAIVLFGLTASYLTITPVIDSFIDQRREIEAERVRVEEEARLAAEAAEQARIKEEQRQAELAEQARIKEDNTGAIFRGPLGLGEIVVSSVLNQPFDAKINLSSGGAGLVAKITPDDAFVRAGIQRTDALNDFVFTVDGNRNNPNIRITSEKPIAEPFLNF